MFEDDLSEFYKSELEGARLNFKLRLFLSLDFSNSTNYKQSIILPPSSSQPSNMQTDSCEEDRIDVENMLSATSPWIAPFSYFISQIDRVIDHVWREKVISSLVGTEQATECNPETLLRPKYWKPIGDEVVYQVRLVHPLQVALCLYCWKIVTKEVRKEIINSRPLNVKSAAWLAGFPINNSEFVVGVTSDDWPFLDQKPFLDQQIDFSTSNYNTEIIHHILPILYRLDRKFFAKLTKKLLKLPEEKTEDDTEDWTEDDIESYRNFARRLQYKQIDFLGPQMDTGFRIADKSTPKKMMISADVAYILSILLAGEIIDSDEQTTSNSNREQPKEESLEKSEKSATIEDSTGGVDKDGDKNSQEQNATDKNTIYFCKIIYSQLKNYLNEDTGNSNAQEPTHKKTIKQLITNDLKIYYAGRFPLKGVREGRPYPLFWLNADEENAIDIAENQLLKDNNVSYNNVRA